MASTAEMAERHGRVLVELAELGLSLARGLQARAEAARTGEDAERLALAFHRVSRSVRLTLALEARLVREQGQAWREERARAVRLVETRKAQVRAAVTRLVLRETEGEDAEALLDGLEERLDEDALYDEFTDDPVEACIARIRAGLGLAAVDPANDAGTAPLLDPSPLAGERSRVADG
jgi:hypothetical protein